MSTRLLVSGKANSGKTTLIKSLPPEESYVIAVDEKPFPFKIPHTNVFGFIDVDSFVNGAEAETEDGELVHVDGVYDKLQKFQDTYGKLPKYLVIDSVSRVFQIAYDNLNDKFPNDNFKLYAALDREIKRLREMLTTLQSEGINVVIISHALYDERTSTYSMVDSGKFAKAGGFLSVVDHAVFIEIKGKKRIIHHKNPSFASRSLVEELPEFQPMEEYSLKDHIDMILEQRDDVQSFML